MRSPYQELETLDAEIRLLEKQQRADWRSRIVELQERRVEIERSLETEKNYYVART
jgi:hypothetical protein